MRLSIVYPCYRQQQTLLAHVDRWRSWPKKLVQNLDFIVVDDCSSEPIRVPAVNLNLRLFRVHDDIIWNYGAKNLGVQKAHCQWVFLSELDHILSKKNVEDFLQLPWKRQFYMFHRTGQREFPHRATYLFNSRDFWDVNGLDEDFCGAYGHDDTYLVECFERNGLLRVVPDGIVLECLMKNEEHGDAELWRCEDVPRDTTRNDKMLAEKLRQAEISTSRIRFDWELVHEYRFDW